MSKAMHVRPAPGLLVRRPDGTPLPPEGAAVPRTSFWLSLLKDGDVLLGPPGAPEPAAADMRKAKGAA